MKSTVFTLVLVVVLFALLGGWFIAAAKAGSALVGIPSVLLYLLWRASSETFKQTN